MQGEQIISALIGLVGAVSNNGKTQQTDGVIRKAFLQIRSGGSEQEMVEAVHQEKFAISPDCAVCKNPCGNTSDYDMDRFHKASESIQKQKLELIRTIGDYLESVQEEKLPDLIYQGIAYLGYDLDENAYMKLIEQIHGRMMTRMQGQQEIRIMHALPQDLPEIFQIYEKARNFMKKTGNPNQWGDHWPAEEMLVEDIRKGNLYVLREGNIIHAAFAFIIGEDPTYHKIEQGKWLSDTEYGTLHRVASDGELHGVFRMIVQYAGQKIGHLRIDTHEDNKVMQHAIEKNGFMRCGIIHIADGSPRIAYEKE